MQWQEMGWQTAQLLCEGTAEKQWLVQGLEPGTQKQGTRHSTPAAVPPVTGTAGRWVAHVLLVFLFGLPAEEESNSGLQGCSRLYSRCSTPPETAPASH